MRVFVGIDIAAKSFDLVVWKHGKNQPVLTFPQNPQGHAKALKKLQMVKPERVVLEATGIYYLDLAVALHRGNIPVSVLNPRSFKHFAQLKLQGSKTDGIDSALLAEYGERMMPRLWTPPTPGKLGLRDLGRQINRLIHARTQAKNRLHALSAKQDTLGLLLDDEQEGIEQLNRRIERLKNAALELINVSSELAKHWKHMMAAKGIAEASALVILAELCVLPDTLKAPQVSRYAGLDVRITQSGTSIHKPGRMSKAGNMYLRSALFMPAMTAVQYEPRAKAFYDALVARGKKKIQALCAVMRKYLTGLWACIKSDTPFDAERLFSAEHMKPA
ncbi:IS110 family transposase [Salinispirillum marinum]|uniref:IS110 family transposase n=2 Tax=Saccharospirillaceae TaxID=255527 RepID=A0ABV8BI46_9GAMM